MDLKRTMQGNDSLFPVDFLPQRTERLMLRRFIDLDLDRFVAYRQDPSVARFQSWSAFSEDDARSFIDEMQTAAIGLPGEWFQIAIAHQRSNLLIGDMGIQINADDQTTMEIGFTLHRQEQGKGYAREAVSALIRVLFGLGIVNKIIAVTDSRNESSVRLLRWLGMTLTDAKDVEFKGEWCIEQTFELDQQDWRALSSEDVRKG